MPLSSPAPESAHDSTPALIARDLEKIYAGTGEPVAALRGVSLTIARGAFVCLMGPSGCGKSTLLHLCGAMDRPTRGSLRIDAADIAALSDADLTQLRRTRLGFVFQFFNLLPTLTVRENIALPLLLAGGAATAALREAARLADRVGLAHRLDHRPAQLSGGEMQRAAIARAVIHRPALLIADEPTGNLDSANGTRILDLLIDLHRETGVTMLMATHAEDVARAADRIVRMKDGRIEQDAVTASGATNANASVSAPQGSIAEGAVDAHDPAAAAGAHDTRAAANAAGDERSPRRPASPHAATTGRE